MSSPHPQQVKWSPFLLLLTLLLKFPSPATSGRCEERCDNNRLPGLTDAYILNCDHLYKTNSDINFCRSDCESCTSDVCKASNPSIYRCPAIQPDSKRCKQRCDENRPSWTSDKYDLDCSQKYHTASEIEHCRTFCKDCPKEICRISIPGKYKCPAVDGPSPPIGGHCLARCNNNRPAGKGEAYTLSCIKEYATVEELRFCRGDCISCPRSVCDLYNPDIFHCPAGNPVTTTTTPAPPVIKGRCKLRCDWNREPGTTDAYLLDCRKKYEFADEAEDCAEDCWSCHRSFCNPHTNKNLFSCPKIPEPLPPPSPPTYKGPCENRCDDNRAKGPYGLSNAAYTLKCDEKYKGIEIKRCKRDCKKCPEDVCLNDENLHHCPRTQVEKRCDDICIANRKYGTIEAYTFKCSTEYSSRFELNYCMSTCQDCSNTVCSDNDTYNCPRGEDHSVGQPNPYPDHYSNRYRSGNESTMLIVGGVIILLLIVGCAGICIYCCVRKKKPMAMAQTGQYYGAPGAGVYPTGGQYAQQQPYQMNQYAQQQPYQMNQYAASPGSGYGR